MHWSNFNEVLLVGYISLLGLLSLRPTCESSLRNNYLLMLGFPLGYTYLVIATLISFGFFSCFNVFFVLLVPLVVLLPLWIGEVKSLKIEISWASIFKVLCCYIFLAFIFRYLNVVVFTCDSFVLMGLASAFVDGLPIEVFVERLLSFPIYILPAHALVKYFGQDYCSSFAPLFFLCTICAIVFYVRKHLSDLEVASSPYSYVVCSITGVFFLSTYFILQQFFYVNGHTAAACIMTILGLEIIDNESVKTSSVNLSNSKVFVIFTLLCAQMFVRMEGILMTSIFLLLLAESRTLTVRQMLTGSVVLSILYVMWTFFIFNTGTEETGYVSLTRMIILISPVIFLAIIYSFSKLRDRIQYLRPLIMLALLLGLLFYVYNKPEHYALANVNILSNILVGTPWGLLWPVLLVFSIFLFQSKQTREDKLIIYVIAIYFALIILLGYFRFPYRNNWKDSANRVFLHVLPLVSYLMILKMVKVFTDRAEKIE